MGVSVVKVQPSSVALSRQQASRRPRALTLARSFCSGAEPVHSQRHCFLSVNNGVQAAAGKQPGGNVLDRPTTAVPGLGDKSDTKKKKPPRYRVMLHNDSFNRREYVVQVLLKVVDGYTVDDAVNVMQKAHVDGLACVISCPQQDAETYCEGLRNNGLISSVEPDN